MSWQDSGPNKVSYNPGPTPQYAHRVPQGTPDLYDPGDGSVTAGHAGESKVEGHEYGQRFEPRKKIRDPIFLVLFVAQVRNAPPSRDIAARRTRLDL